ncbi:pilus assembly FimT family protein [Candidatus Absconditicoccus praedator]|uniref:pilus assembly FimT family protein n=1 Tax=Candidatus Absconditicoccus praedator TaxID=2735562 RepID=UPI001E4A1F26|nr:hypothetical protein [Candidatus Absconditicoccus praedator]UFX82791.1 hypothetical protein HLG78_01420 [Candidatus Absconditicoccus praedator]
MIAILVIIGVLSAIAIPNFDFQREEDIAGVASQAEELVMDIKRLDVINNTTSSTCKLHLENNEKPWKYKSDCNHKNYGIQFGSTINTEYTYPEKISIPDSDCKEISISSDNHNQKVAIYPTGHAELGECNNE